MTELLFFPFFTLLAIILLVGFYVWSIIDVLVANRENTWKILWIIIIITFQILGSIAYYLIEKHNMKFGIKSGRKRNYRR